MEKLALYFAPSVPCFEDWCSRLPYVFSHSSDWSLASPLRAGDYDYTCFQLNQWQQAPYIRLCLKFIRAWFWTGDFSEQRYPATSFLRNPYFKIVFSPSEDSKYFCTSKHLFIHLSISYINVLSLPQLIE